MDKIVFAAGVVCAVVVTIGCGYGTTEERVLIYNSVVFMESTPYKTPKYFAYFGETQSDTWYKSKLDATDASTNCDIMLSLKKDQPPVLLTSITLEMLELNGYTPHKQMPNHGVPYWGECGVFYVRDSRIVGTFFYGGSIGRKDSTKVIQLPVIESEIHKLFGPPLKTTVRRSTRTAP